MPLLTKSKYLIGLQCPKYLWLAVNDKEKIPDPDLATQHRFEEGSLIGEYAKKLFPSGIDLSTYSFIENIKKTKEAIKQKKILFEPGFLFENCFSRGDILIPVKDQWDIIEVKSGTKVKDINIKDVSFQKYVYENFGLKIRKCYLMHVNNQYIRKGKIEPNKLFIKEDITNEVNEITNIKERIDDMFKIISNKECPKGILSKNCEDPYSCPIKECYEYLPENNIFHLCGAKKMCYKLLEDGIHTIKDIPEEIKLTAKQQVQRECERENKSYINKEAIEHFLRTLHYPLYYLDFETFNTAIPMFDGLKPYQQVLFQFSLHVVEKEGEKPKHYEFLYSGNNDPRKEFLMELKKVLGFHGSIVVYNQPFEIGRLKELGFLFSENDWVNGILTRIVDLLVPFRNFSYYNPKQKGSASLKNVLPALVGKSYKELEITEGGVASMEFFNIAYGKVSEKEKEKVRKNLLQYCGLDTEGMVWIVNKLKKLV